MKTCCSSQPIKFKREALQNLESTPEWPLQRRFEPVNPESITLPAGSCADAVFVRSKPSESASCLDTRCLSLFPFLLNHPKFWFLLVIFDVWFGVLNQEVDVIEATGEKRLPFHFSGVPGGERGGGTGL